MAISFTLDQCLPLKKDSKQHEALLRSQLHYMIAFPYYVVSLKTGPYTGVTTRCCKTVVITDGYFPTT